MPARITKAMEWRCRWSDKGKQEIRPANPDVFGTAWHHVLQSNYVRVQWDNHKEPITYLAEYIEAME